MFQKEWDAIGEFMKYNKSRLEMLPSWIIICGFQMKQRPVCRICFLINEYVCVSCAAMDSFLLLRKFRCLIRGARQSRVFPNLSR